ncbi:uncharacterized protein DUF3800 [Halopolyspora algeriensis]|uniref:Uncharacterized protein DUF3800 n=1 Tax=Halopolyspora algeriensis TaxID=1500506 RepID=A0A368VH62_9ACTN|nr:DUF3800 domain-containing protein [Halopolyspora algeriensis]RCW39987.1 uncharacterized protein DUF3800 [Halopolyspora algeriensis]TQM46576.1 uncharacterized protein DUF3800 [Halopolyspora algeriensis]
MPQTPSWAGKLPKLEVYVDETGDRGFSKTSSPFPAMTALIIPQERIPQARAVAGGLRYVVGTSRPLHWTEHFKAKHSDRRELAAGMLANIADVKVIHVIAHKETITFEAALRSDAPKFYNYTTRLLMERIAWAARDWPSGSRLAVMRLGSVRHMDHKATINYLNLVRAQSSSLTVPREHVAWPPKWYGTSSYDGIQLADIYAGMLNLALTGAPNDHDCAKLLVQCGHQLRRHNGTLLGRGIKVIGEEDYITNRCWWRALHQAC